MDEHDGAGKAGEQKKSKALSLEQQRKFEELRERRLQLKNAQDVVSSGKKKKKKRKRAKNPGSSSPKAATSDKQQLSIRDQSPTAIVKFGSQERHVFAVTTGESTAEGGQLSTARDISVSQPSRGSGREGGLDSIPLQNPSTAIVPAKTLEASNIEAPARTKKKRKKLAWGMEIKERWERKGNM